MSAAETRSGSPITSFVKHHYRHFNAAVVIDACDAYVKHLASGGKMFVTLAGAMSTAVSRARASGPSVSVGPVADSPASIRRR